MGGPSQDKDTGSVKERASDVTIPSPSLTRASIFDGPNPEPVDDRDVERAASHSSTDSHVSHESASRPPLRPTFSRASSIRRDAVKVPRNQRRGLLARFAVLPEVTNPYDLNNKTKWTITAVVAFAAVAAPMGSTIVFPALNDISRVFDASPVITNMSVAFYMLSMSIFPLWWSSFSETLGRRTIYITSFFLYLIFNILSALSVNISMFIVMRILSGGASASVQAVGAGTVADVWEVRERGRAMGYFYLGPLCGPLLAPILGGVLTQTLGWRAALWSQAVYGVILWVAIVLFLPETLKNRRPVKEEAEAEAIASTLSTEQKDGGTVRPTLTRTTTKQSAKIKAKKYTSILRRWFLDPLKIIHHLQKPPVAISVFYASMTFSSLYFLNISIQQTFQKSPYNYNVLIVGLLYIPNSVGYFIASIFGGSWVDRIMKREAQKANRYDERGRLIFLPEDRMRENIYMAAVMFPIALIWYGWTAEKGVNIAAPMVANFFFGVGSMLVFGCLTTMLTEFMPKQSSHGIALNNFVRNIFSCIAGIVGEPAIVGIGNGWLFTILGLWTLVAGIFSLWAMKYFARRWREAAAEQKKQEVEMK
ncbi:MFS general substrate transporter [Myriangium duriaei CBS 260.36]|uniref:MFS general substrate transporter n=1 Tax=Myriangium duriaei CBS 260.36 TaxID=1168546 RepID=A0A9P4JCH6_9PEZI|nr:MFS general substrate transporter [Myriangium duriaei CBS 260.36]